MHTDITNRSKISAKRLVLVIFVAVFSVVQLLNALASIVNAAPATTYTWKDRQTISVSGGDVKSGQTLYSDPNANIPTLATGNITTSEIQAQKNCSLFGIFCNTSNATVDCYIGLSLKIDVPKSNSPVVQGSGTTATISAPKPQSSLSTSGGVGVCQDDTTYAEYNGKHITISGARPSNTNSTAETENQKAVNFTVTTNLSQDQAPDSVTIIVDTVPASANTEKIITAAKDKTSQNVIYASTSGSLKLDPGNYTAKVTGVDGISPVTFQKVKFDGPRLIQLGNAEGFGNRQISVIVAVDTSGGAGLTSVGPLDVFLYDTAGKNLDSQKTNIVQIDSTNQGTSSSSRFYNLTTHFDNLDAGSYKVCLGSGTTNCQTVIKDTSKSSSVKFNITGQAANDLVNVTDSPTCGSLVSNVGWIVCPIISGLSTLNDGMWSLLVNNLLKVDPIASSGANSIQPAWVIIRNLANIAFVIVFLLIIFSQLTSVGIANYGVKKMLPRLIVGAILVNVSFLVVQILVDVSNILGGSLYDLIVKAAPPVTATWTGLIAMVSAAAGAAAVGGVAIAVVGGAAAAFWIILPMAAMAVLGLLAAILTLIFRQALIPILAILAPLAFVALLLPNTESWFKKWRGMLINLLMLYPMAALVFGGAQFASAVIMNKTDWWLYLIGLLVLSLPLFSLPFLARQGGPLLTKVGSGLNGLASKLGKPIANFAAPKRELAEKKYMSAKPSDVSKFNIGRRVRLAALRGRQADKANGSAYDRLMSENTDDDILAGKLDRRLGPENAAIEKDAAALRQKKREAELIESGAQNIKRTFGSTGTIGAAGVPGGAEHAFAEAFASGDRIKMLSAMSVLAGGGPVGIEKLHSSALGISPSQNPELFKAFQNELNGVPGLKSKDAALAKLAYTEGGELWKIGTTPGTYSGLSAADAASQTEGSLRRIQAAGAMSPGVANEILSNATLSGQLTPITEQIIKDIASSGAAVVPRKTLSDLEEAEAEELDVRRNNPPS